MGPIAHTKEYSPGVIVKNHLGDIGTIIENYATFDIDSGSRTEKALVLWSHGTTTWISIKLLEIINSI